MSKPTKEEKERMEYGFWSIAFTCGVAAALLIGLMVFEHYVLGVIV